MTIRLEKIECWKCDTPFDYSSKAPDDHKYRVYCPFCEAENVVDLHPFIKREDIVFRGATKTKSKLTNQYELPDKLQGIKPEEQ